MTLVCNRRSFLASAGAGLLCSGGPAFAEKGKPTTFQIACMTLVYSAFPLQRALAGIKGAGYDFVAWGTTHADANGKRVPVLAPEAGAVQALELGQRCRDQGLTPVMMFSGIYPEARQHQEVMRQRLRQAAAAGIGQVLTFGAVKGGDRTVWRDQFRQLAPVARDLGVQIVIKQHGGLTADGARLLAVVQDIGDPNIGINYDAGNVMDYLKVDAARVLEDGRHCASAIRSFCIKDHRLTPKDEDCGPGFGQIDHYQLLQPVTFTGRTIPLCCENISAPLLPRPRTPEGIDALARRAREFLEMVTRGLQA